MKKSLIKYSAAVGVASAMTVGILLLRDFGALTSTSERLRHLADAFTIPGVIFMMVAALLWVSSDGFFDGVAYCGRQLLRLVPFVKVADERYADFKERRGGKRVKGYSFIFFTGLAFFAVAVVLIVLFYLN